jgi:hypothetical protein
MKKKETPEDVRKWFEQHTAKLWPLALGCLSLRRGPCIQANCSACQSGEGHASYALYGKRAGKRFSLYVPDDLAKEVGKALGNGEQLRQLMVEAGYRYATALKGVRSRTSRAGGGGRKK